MKNKLIYAILSLLGLTMACSKDKYSDRDITWRAENKNTDKDDTDNDTDTESPKDREDDDSAVCMYGTPMVTFSVKGRVTDMEGEPIEGIRVKVDYMEKFTDSLGKFDLKNIQTFGFGEERFLYKQLEVQDVDGEKNGSFKDREIKVQFIRNNNNLSGAWHFGNYDAPDIDVVLQAGSEDE